ncbi:MAG TPA: family 1 glycosylhydrolase [Patescibacteria group bacterium]|nr:family 1 glycosylhydrolase [Patescibacteria group bacterium]
MSKKTFFWGASTASHQVEGGTVNQWSVWELANATHLAKTAYQRYGWLPNWEEVKKEAEDPNNYVSGKGVDHLNRYKEDFDILEKLGLNAFRFSIQWARIEPEEGKWDVEAISHYKEYIKELNKRGIEPFLNIWHWTMPCWFAEKGGFTKHTNLKYFEEYIRKIAEELLDGVDYVITLNEPNVYASESYIEGRWPPQEKNYLKGIWVYINLVNAHKRTWRILKTSKPSIKIGIAQHLVNVQAYRPGNIFDELVVKLMRHYWNWWFLNRIKKFQDFVGVNNYFTDYYKGFKKVMLKTPANDLGWYMAPESLLNLLQRTNAHYPGKPIIVTENGLADAKDQYRQWWISETMKAIDTAKSQDIPVIGYLHWSLLDNFEWADGWWPKFGLVEVNREHDMKRTIRPSALWWAEELKKRKKLEDGY